MKIFRAEKGIPEPEEKDAKAPTEEMQSEQAQQQDVQPEEVQPVSAEAGDNSTEEDDLEQIKSHWWEDTSEENRMTSSGMDTPHTRTDDQPKEPEDEFARALQNRLYSDHKDEQ